MADDEQRGPVEVEVAVDDAHVGSRFGDVVTALREAGLRIAQELPALGAITGSIDDPGAIEALRAVDGVAAAEPSRQVGIPPPDAPIQ